MSEGPYSGAGESDPQYNQLNAGAHRRPSPQIAAPAIVWHRGFWCNDRTRNANFVGVALDENSWQHRVDATLYQIFVALRRASTSPKPNSRGGFVSPNFDHNGGILYLFRHKVHVGDDYSANVRKLVRLEARERSVRHDVFSFRCDFNGLALMVVARLHHEYFTITFALGLSAILAEEKAKPRTARDLPATLRVIVETFHDSHNFIRDRFQQSRAQAANDLTRDQLTLVDRAYDDIVERFRTWTTEFCHGALSNDTGGPGGTLDHCGGLFGDFNGVVFGLKPGDDPSKLVRTPLTKPRHTLTIRRQVLGADYEAGGVDLDLIDAAWPLIRRLSPHFEGERNYGKPEYTASLVQGGHSIYVSSLGQLLPESVRSDVGPVTYVLFVSYASKWRLGRLVDRLHSLGTLRLAALRDIQSINQADDEINLAFQDLSRAINRTEMSKILTDRVNSIAWSVDGGLMYRVSRSRYYVSNFKELVRMLGAKGVVGFTSYESFVSRRIYDAFDYIDRVGMRYDELRRQFTFAINSTYRAAMQSNTEATTSLLKAAERISFIPIGYYMGTMLTTIAASTAREHPAWRPFLPQSEWLYYLIGLGIGVVVAFGFLGAARSMLRGSGPRLAAIREFLGDKLRQRRPPAA